MENLNFEVYNDDGDMVAQIQVFDDGSFWIKNDEEHAVAVNEVEEEETQTRHDHILNVDAVDIVTTNGVLVIQHENGGQTRINKDGVTHTN